MRTAMTVVSLGLAFLCGACGLPEGGVHAGGIGMWSEPGFARWRAPGYEHGFGWRAPVTCDAYGRCWRRGFDEYWPGHGVGHPRRAGPQVPLWADDLPDRARTPDRFLEPRPGVVCDRTTRVCYRDRKVDERNTANVFGERAGQRTRDLRDVLGTPLVFVPKRGAICDREDHVCVEGGRPDRGLTRRYFGKKAADELAVDRVRPPERLRQPENRGSKQSPGPKKKKRRPGA